MHLVATIQLIQGTDEGISMMRAFFDFHLMLELCRPRVFQRDMAPVDGRAVVVEIRARLILEHFDVSPMLEPCVMELAVAGWGQLSA